MFWEFRTNLCIKLKVWKEEKFTCEKFGQKYFSCQSLIDKAPFPLYDIKMLGSPASLRKKNRLSSDYQGLIWESITRQKKISTTTKRRMLNLKLRTGPWQFFTIVYKRKECRCYNILMSFCPHYVHDPKLPSTCLSSPLRKSNILGVFGLFL